MRYLIILVIALLSLVFVAGCVISNECVPVTPQQVTYKPDSNDCIVIIADVAYDARRDACPSINVNQTNFVRFEPEAAGFPIITVCKMKER